MRPTRSIQPFQPLRSIQPFQSLRSMQLFQINITFSTNSINILYHNLSKYRTICNGCLRCHGYLLQMIRYFDKLLDGLQENTKMAPLVVCCRQYQILWMVAYIICHRDVFKVKNVLFLGVKIVATI
jgi:hypothetical protein